MTSGASYTQIQIFKQIWAMSDKRSYLSGLFLREFEGTQFFINCFAHVLAKGQNKCPNFAVYAKNIILLKPIEHHLLDNGTDEMRQKYTMDHPTANWGKIEDLEEELMEEYKKYFPYTYHGIIGYKYDSEEVLSRITKLNNDFFNKG